MAINSPVNQSKLNPEVQAFLEAYCGSNLTEAELLEIKDSLYHLGRAIYLYRLMQSAGGKRGE